MNIFDMIKQVHGFNSDKNAHTPSDAKDSEPPEGTPYSSQNSSKTTFAGGAMVSGAEIDEWGLICQGPNSKKEYQTSSYDLCLGEYHYVTNENGQWDHFFIGKGDIDKRYAKEFVSPTNHKESIIIPPFGSAIIQLDECIDTLTVFFEKQILVAGRFDLKLSTIYKGLISQQATQVEPLYFGRLFCFVHNLSSKEVQLNLGDRVATIEFLRVSQYNNEQDSDLKSKYIKDVICMVTASGNEWKYRKIGSFTFENLDAYAIYPILEPYFNECGIDSSNYCKIGLGIENVCWFNHSNRLPDECGLTPINNKVTGEMKSYIDSYLDKSDTVDRIGQRVKTHLDEHNNLAKVVTGMFGLIFSGALLNYFLDVRAEMYYFKEELSLLLTEKAGGLDIEVVKRIDEHSQMLRNHSEALERILIFLIIFAIVVLLVSVGLEFWKKRRAREKADTSKTKNCNKGEPPLG